MPLELGEAAFAHSMNNLRSVRHLEYRLNVLEQRSKAMLRLFSPFQLIEYHRYLYYNGTPEITDKEYDVLVKSLDSYY